MLNVAFVLHVQEQPPFRPSFSHFLHPVQFAVDSQVPMLAYSLYHSILWYDEYHSFHKHLKPIVRIQHHQYHFDVVYHPEVE